MSRENPYQLLKREFGEWTDRVVYPKKQVLWEYPKAQLNSLWKLHDLYERVAAAKQLGYEVVLEARDTGLLVRYVEQRPDTPHWRLSL